MKYFSPKGLEELKKELEELKIKRYEITRRLEETKALGDLSENQEYSLAREAQSFNEGRIMELEQLLREAVIIDKVRKTDTVQIGSTVEASTDSKTKIFTIVGSEESEPASGRISNESPLGKAFLGRKVGEAVEVETPGGKVKYKIIEIK